MKTIKFKPQYTGQDYNVKGSYCIEGKTCIVKIKLTKKNWFNRIIDKLNKLIN